MEQLIGFRLLQGLGAGGMLPITRPFWVNLYPLEQRARITACSARCGVSRACSDRGSVDSNRARELALGVLRQLPAVCAVHSC